MMMLAALQRIAPGWSRRRHLRVMAAVAMVVWLLPINHYQLFPGGWSQGPGPGAFLPAAAEPLPTIVDVTYRAYTERFKRFLPFYFITPHILGSCLVGAESGPRGARARGLRALAAAGMLCAMLAVLTSSADKESRKALGLSQMVYCGTACYLPKATKATGIALAKGMAKNAVTMLMLFAATTAGLWALTVLSPRRELGIATAVARRGLVAFLAHEFLIRLLARTSLANLARAAMVPHAMVAQLERAMEDGTLGDSTASLALALCRSGVFNPLRALPGIICVVLIGGVCQLLASGVLFSRDRRGHRRRRLQST